MGRPAGSKNKPKPLRINYDVHQVTVTIGGELWLQMQAISIIKRRSIELLVKEGIMRVINLMSDDDKKALDNMITFGHLIVPPETFRTVNDQLKEPTTKAS